MAAPSAGCSTRSAYVAGSITATPSSVLTHTRPVASISIVSMFSLVRPSALPMWWKRARPSASRRSRICTPALLPTQSRPWRSVSSVLMTAEARLPGSPATGTMRSTGRPGRTRLSPLFVATHIASPGPGRIAVTSGSLSAPVGTGWDSGCPGAPRSIVQMPSPLPPIHSMWPSSASAVTNLIAPRWVMGTGRIWPPAGGSANSPSRVPM